MTMHKTRLCQIAEAMWRTDGRDTDGASTGERAAAALLAGRPEWAGYTTPDGRTDVFAIIDRLDDYWLGLVRSLYADFTPPGQPSD